MPASYCKAEDFKQEVMHSKVPVLVDFFAEWCGPCKMLAPVLDEVADELGESAEVMKIDVDGAQELASSFNVASIPHLLIIKDGEVVDQVVGVVSKEVLLEKMKVIL